VGLATSFSACRGKGAKEPGTSGCDPKAQRGDLRINEVVSKNEGVWIDHTGQTEDLIELINRSEKEIELRDFTLRDADKEVEIQGGTLAPGERIVLFADGQPEEGPDHIDFKLSSSGDQLSILSCETVIDSLDIPTLGPNESYARFPDGDGDFARCRYASPSRANGDECGPPSPESIAESVTFADFTWPPLNAPSPLALSELALRPAEFIEVRNTSSALLDLSGYTLHLGPITPAQTLPASTASTHSLSGQLAPGSFTTIALSAADTAAIEANGEFEGVARLFAPDGSPVDTLTFMRWPEGSTLARPPEVPSQTHFCQSSTRGAENTCTPLASRPVGDRVRALRTPGDFAALAEGYARLGTESVKFVVDIAQGEETHFLRAADWALHYTFVREVIDGEPPLDRCDTVERAEFRQGWVDFSNREYFSEVGRNYFLGTLSKHGSVGLNNMEFAIGDVIPSSGMRTAFFAVMESVEDPTRWSVRPQSDAQVERAKETEGRIPLVAPEAPFVDMTYQPLTHGEGFGVLTFVSASELHSTPLGAQVLLVTDDVPNDIPLVGGLITEAFQTPLAHVNVLSQNRGTPNMALRDARNDPRIEDLLGKLVRLEVSGGGFTLEEADPEQASAFWANFAPSGPTESPRLDTSERALISLEEVGLEALPLIGAKAAGLAELTSSLSLRPDACKDVDSFSVPAQAFAVPVVHFIEHFEASGAKAAFEKAKEESNFDSDPIFRGSQLEAIQNLILEHPVSPPLLRELEEAIESRYGTARVRLRSSSNAEDLPGFNGAGLYNSLSAAIEDPERPVEDALRGVWASLYNSRAYDERELARIDHGGVAMGVLVHEAFLNEAANGVAVSRNVLDPIRGDVFYLNAQAGEASVTNPAPGITTEALTFQWTYPTPLVKRLSQSGLTQGKPVLSDSEALSVSCGLYGIHHHYQAHYDSEGEDPWFAMEIEFKLDYPSRDLLIKQARPHVIGGFDIIGDCREF